MYRQLDCKVSRSIWAALEREAAKTGHSMSHVVQKKLAEAFDIEQHTIFQVSTITAIAKGLFQGCASIEDLKNHGDFGLGTFENLDGELIMIDGQAYCARAQGVTDKASDGDLVPFATTAHFRADSTTALNDVTTLSDLENRLDGIRPSENTFVAIRMDGLFQQMDLRAACKALPGEDLVAATKHQSEFSFQDIEGTLVGFWSPDHARTITLSGYHLHFISADRKTGGHVLGLKALDLVAGLHTESDLHVVIPETQAFLEANLKGDPTKALNIAEKGFVRDR